MIQFYFTPASTFLYLTITLSVLLYVYFRKCRRYWLDKDVPYIESSSSFLFGNVRDVVTLKIPEIEHSRRLYRQLAPHKFGGYYAFHRPRLIVRDPELLKAVLTKDFAHFYDRNEDIFRKDDILSKNLFNMIGEPWKLLRAKLTSTFSSGKMKFMFSTMAERARSMVDTLERTLSEQNHKHIEVKDLMSRYTMEVIASCAFGLEVNSLEDPDSPIRKIALKGIDVNWRFKILLPLVLLWPHAFKRLGVKFNDVKQEEFYRQLVSDTISYRKKNDVKKNDFIGLLMSIRDEDELSAAFTETMETDKFELTMDLMAAQCFVFLIAGFETSSSTMAYCLLELSKDTKIQERLRQQVRNVSNETNGEITYESLSKMPYMDQVISETLRMYPLLPFLNRVCTKPYRIPDTKVVLEKGTIIDIPVAGIHYDPEYYPNPDEFNPDNFSEENKYSRPSYTFLPFGEGPRICIGMRFGLMQAKLGLAMLLKNYEFKLSPKTKLPLEFLCNSVGSVTAVKGIWLSFNRLNPPE